MKYIHKKLTFSTGKIACPTPRLAPQVSLRYAIPEHVTYIACGDYGTIDYIGVSANPVDVGVLNSRLLYACWEYRRLLLKESYMNVEHDCTMTRNYSTMASADDCASLTNHKITNHMHTCTQQSTYAHTQIKQHTEHKRRQTYIITHK